MAPKRSSGAVKGKVVTHSAVRQMLNAQREKKYYTAQSFGAAVPANGTVVAMTQGIILGDADNTRDGGQINFDRLDINLRLFINSLSTVDFVRLLIVQDHQNNGALPLVTDIITSTDPNATYTRNVRVVNRYTVLHDSYVPLSIAANNRSYVMRTSIKKSFKISYLGNTDVAASNGKNSIYYLICGDSALGDALFTLDWAVSFYDS
jgi:hypothetical protein